MAKRKDKNESFETYLNELEEIVEKLESGEIDLDEAIKQYESGIKLISKCREALKQTKTKIEILKKKTEDGYEAEEFEDSSTDSTNSSRGGSGPSKDKKGKGDGELPF